jgi:hypothetical protein
MITCHYCGAEVEFLEQHWTECEKVPMANREYGAQILRTLPLGKVHLVVRHQVRDQMLRWLSRAPGFETRGYSSWIEDMVDLDRRLHILWLGIDLVGTLEENARIFHGQIQRACRAEGRAATPWHGLSKEQFNALKEAAAIAHAELLETTGKDLPARARYQWHQRSLQGRGLSAKGWDDLDEEAKNSWREEAGETWSETFHPSPGME